MYSRYPIHIPGMCPPLLPRSLETEWIYRALSWGEDTVGLWPSELDEEWRRLANDKTLPERARPFDVIPGEPV